MNGSLFGASGRRLTAALFERGHIGIGVSQSGRDAIEHPDLEAVIGNRSDAVAKLAVGRDAVASALGEDVLHGSATGLREGLQRTDVDRLLRVGGAGGRSVGPDAKLIETDEFPDELGSLAKIHISALDREAETSSGRPSRRLRSSSPG